MPAGPAPTIASRSLVMVVLSGSAPRMGLIPELVEGLEAEAFDRLRDREGLTGAVGDSLSESGEGFAHGAVGEGVERLDRLARPAVGEIESGRGRLVIAQLGERLVEDRGIGAVGDAGDAVVDA